MTTESLGNYLSTPRTNRYRGKYFCRVEDYDYYKNIDHHNKSYAPIVCIETGEEFESMSAAGRWLKEHYPEYKGTATTMATNISKAIKMGWKSYGFTWKKIES